MISRPEITKKYQFTKNFPLSLERKASSRKHKARKRLGEGRKATNTCTNRKKSQRKREIQITSINQLDGAFQVWPSSSEQDRRQDWIVPARRQTCITSGWKPKREGFVCGQLYICINGKLHIVQNASGSCFCYVTAIFLANPPATWKGNSTLISKSYDLPIFKPATP